MLHSGIWLCCLKAAVFRDNKERGLIKIPQITNADSHLMKLMDCCPKVVEKKLLPLKYWSNTTIDASSTGFPSETIGLKGLPFQSCLSGSTDHLATGLFM